MDPCSIKQRFLGSAYENIANKKFASIEELSNYISETYLKKRSLDQIRECLMLSKQNAKESASMFGRKLEAIFFEAQTIIVNEWEEGDRRALLEDVRRLTVRSFIKGLKDQSLKHKFVGRELDKLSELIELAERASDLLGDNSSSIHFSKKSHQQQANESPVW